MFKKIFIFIMIFAIVFVFVFDTNIASATTATFGDIYGTELGSEMLAFLLASLAVGVTYNSLLEVEELFKISEPIDWDEILGSAPDPPPGGGHNPNKKLITALLLGVPGGAFLSSIFGDLINWFQGKDATEGENIIDVDSDIITEIDDIEKSYVTNLYAGKILFVTLYNNNVIKVKMEIDEVRGYPYISPYLYINNEKGFSFGHLYIIGDDTPHYSPEDRTVTYKITETTSNIRINLQISPYVNVSKAINKNDLITEGEGYQPETTIKYNVKQNSSVITGIPPTTIPQPDITKLPGIETITKPNGQEEVIYSGDFEDLVNEIVNNITFDDIKNIITGSNPYIITETEQGLKIDRGQESPFPDVNTDPIEDTATYQGTTVGLLQSIINWLSLIRNEISSLPEKLFEVPQDLTLNFDNLKLNGFQERFPFSIPWDIASAISVFSRNPSEPDLTIDMDTNYFTLNHDIDISAISLPLRFARYAASVFFVLYLANKTRDLIKW